MTNFDPDSGAVLNELESLSNNLEPDSNQQDILRAIVGIARGITADPNGNEPRNLQKDFDEAYEPLTKDQVKVLLALKAGPPMIVKHEQIVPSANGLSAQPPDYSRVQLKIAQSPQQ
jgi:hypothetical protein